jgi:uncharacterized protein YndB with AHSA1/START domain
LAQQETGMNLRLQREINAPVDVVYSLLTDIATLALWLDGLQEATYTSSYNAQNPKGATFKRTFIENGETLEFEGEVVTFNKPHHFAIQLKRKKIPVSVQLDYKLTPVPDGTLLNYEAQLVNVNWLVRKVAATMNEASMKQQQAEQLDKLKAVAEQQWQARQQPADNDTTQSAETALDTPIPDPNPPALSRLTVHTPYKTWQLELHSQPLWTIGRGTDNDIVIDHQKVSRNHARIEQQENSFVVQDLGSTNGTWLNQQQIQCHTLQHMDTLTIGNAQLTFKNSNLSSV